MNCKPGDLAVVVVGPHIGKLVEVLHLAPFHNFQLPDGCINKGEPDGWHWCVKVLGAPVWVDIKDHPYGGRHAMYGTVADASLRPIKGRPIDETIDEEITA